MNGRAAVLPASYRGQRFRSGQIWQTPYGQSRVVRVGRGDVYVGGGRLEDLSFGHGRHTSSLRFQIIDPESPINQHPPREFVTTVDHLDDIAETNLPNAYGGPWELLVDALGGRFSE